MKKLSEKALENFMNVGTAKAIRFRISDGEVIYDAKQYHNWLNEDVDNPYYFKGEAIEKPKKVKRFNLYLEDE